MKALVLLILAAFAVASLGAVAQVTPPAPVVDTVARAKFPKADPELVDLLAWVNTYVNNVITYESDKEHYGVSDLWIMAPGDDKGDCEDYALTKMFILGQGGFPIVSRTKVVGVTYADSAGTAVGHAILAVRLPSGEIMYLDNRYKEPMTRKELVKYDNYQFYDWKA